MSRPLVDSCVRVFPRSDSEIDHFLPRPFKGMVHGHPFGTRYVPPIDDFSPVAAEALGRDGVGDPGRVADLVFTRWGAEAAVLLPPNRLLRADFRHDVALASATNEWLASSWLDHSGPGRFFGSIMVSLAYPDQAVREIERWAKDPRFVQVAVPLHVHSPFGDERYFEVWAAAAGHALPVAVHGDGGGGLEFPATFAGLPAHYLEYFTILPSNGIIHLASLISEGIFERLPNLVFVFSDGGLGVFPPLLWRHDVKARALKNSMPWVSRLPSEYLPLHVRFVTRRADFPASEQALATALKLSRAEETLMYGSNLPLWDLMVADEVTGRLPEALIAKVRSGNALATYPKLREHFASEVSPAQA